MLSFCLLQGKAHADIFIIVSEDCPLESITASELKKIFTGRGKSASGIRLNPILLSDGKTHQEFLAHYVKRTSAQLKQSWKKIVFTGKASAPKKANTEKDVISAIKNSNKLIGYIKNKELAQGVKILKVL
ncbi:MAG: hypothetical protein HQL32_14345 [Planctomycetes bacterium]|nr:hypothetical protein [Planctomycetota bacterium]